MGDTEFKLGDKVSVFMDGNEIIAINFDSGDTRVFYVSENDSDNLRQAIYKILNKKREKIKFSDDMSIWCNNLYEYHELIKILDHMGYTWRSGLPMNEYTPSNKGRIRIYLNDGKMATFMLDKTHRDEKHKFVYFCDVDFSDYVPEIKVGDTVEVVNPGRAYTTYHSFFMQADIPREVCARYAFGYGNVPEKGAQYEVIYYGKHTAFKDTYVYAITKSLSSDLCPVYLIGKDGIKLVKRGDKNE